MNSRIITDISNYIFVSDAPQKADAIFLPGVVLCYIKWLFLMLK